MNNALAQWQRLQQASQQIHYESVAYYQIGPWIIALAFANASLHERLARAFAHVRVTQPCQGADLTIRIWENADLPDGKMPTLDWERIHRNGYFGYYENPVSLHYFESIQALSAFHAEEQVAYYCVKSAEQLSWWVSGSPLQVPLHWWLRERGALLTHTAAVGSANGVVLLTGKGGSGKSTTVLSCLQAGMGWLGEDYCVLRPGARPLAYTVYQSAKWLPQTRKFFPDYEFAIANPDTADAEKALVYYEDLFPGQGVQLAPIRAVIAVRIGQDTQPMVQPLSVAEAVSSLAISTMRQLPLSDARTLQMLQGIVAAVPRYRLTLGPRLEANVAVIQRCLGGE